MLSARLRTEGAYLQRPDSLGNAGYGRAVLDATVTRTFGHFAASVTGVGGGAVGNLPSQRAFYLGGLQTVRGQVPSPDEPGHVGDRFWLARTEVGLGRSPAFRPSFFYDAGWAGPHQLQPGRALSGAGAGLSILDGLLRLDVARGIWPEQKWRVYAYFGGRF